MNEFILYADSASDIDQKRAEAYGVKLIELRLTMDGTPAEGRN